MSETKFDISIDRVEKIPVPLLVIGLGGTGCDVLQTVKQVFAERYVLPKNAKGEDLPAPNNTAYLGFDSVSQRPNGLEINEYVDISLPGIDKMLADQSHLLTTDERTWVNQSLRHSSNGIGMGTIRQAARLSLSRNYGIIEQAISGALSSITQATAGVPGPMIRHAEVAIITGIGGGTGSGTFLDMAQIVRHISKTTFPVKITGYIVMPDVSLDNVGTAPGMKPNIRHNSFAALKELDFWMRVRQHETPYTMVYGNGIKVRWNEAPFDQCVLMSCSNSAGIPYKDGYMTVRNTIAENLMHYLAAEDGADTQYSYRQYEDNLAAISTVKNYPLNYVYRTIGAFTKRIPKKSVLYYEGSKLMNTFIPLKDKNGKLQPARTLFQDGKTKPRADEITLTGKSVVQDFATVCKLPNFCSLDINDRIKVATVAEGNTPPHNQYARWSQMVSQPAAIEYADRYLAAGWDRFVKFANSVMIDPEQGPFALALYLESDEGLLPEMEKTLAGWEKRANETRTMRVKQGEDSCVAAWPTFRNPPLLGRTRSLEIYVHDLSTLYNAVRERDLLAYAVPALKKLILRIREYLRDGLKPLCATVLKLEGEFTRVEMVDNVVLQDIYPLADVQDSIDSAFVDANANFVVTRQFLTELMRVSLMAQECVDDSTSGLEFLCQSRGLAAMCTTIEAVLEKVFGKVNDQSLDTIMHQQAGEDVRAQQNWMDKIASSALQSALPMFKQDKTFESEDKAAYSYMSIPNDAVEHITYISKAFKSHTPAVEPKASTLHDHIYCLMAWDKLPLYRYGLMEDLSRQYYEDLGKDNSLGVHLVRSGAPDADYMTDWTLLPSPKPYFLFQPNGDPIEEKIYNKIHTLVERAMKCGMITVATDMPYATMKLARFAERVNNVPYTSDTLLAMADRIMAEIDPATGAPYTKKEQATKLKAFLESATKVTMEQKEVPVRNLAPVIGLSYDRVDPFDANIRANPDMYAAAMKNHEKLCVVMCEAMIYNDPEVLRVLEMQLPAYEKVHALAHDDTAETWAKRVEYAETVADMFIYLNGKIYLGNNGYKYRSKAGAYDIITPALLPADLKGVRIDMLQLVGYLADVDANNAAKHDLTQMLKNATRDFSDKQDDGDLTKEEVLVLANAAEDLAEELEEPKTQLLRQSREEPDKADIISLQLQVIEEIIAVANKRAKYFRRLARTLEE